MRGIAPIEHLPACLRITQMVDTGIGQRPSARRIHRQAVDDAPDDVEHPAVANDSNLLPRVLRSHALQLLRNTRTLRAADK